MKVVRFSRQAESRLGEIALWTVNNFGVPQSRKYETELIARINALANSEPPHGRPCDLLVKNIKNIQGLLYIRAGGHFIIYRELDESITIIDFVHASRDLEAILGDLDVQ